MVITLIGEKWRPSIIYLQMLSFVGMMYPLHALNLNMLQVQGRSDLFLKLEIVKKILAVPIIIIGVLWGIKAMIGGLMVNTLVAYFLNSFWSGSKIGYSMKEQINDILPSLVMALLMSAVVFTVGKLLPFSYLLVLLIQLGVGTVSVLVFCELVKFKEYIFIKELIVEKIRDFRK